MEESEGTVPGYWAISAGIPLIGGPGLGHGGPPDIALLGGGPDGIPGGGPGVGYGGTPGIPLIGEPGKGYGGHPAWRCSRCTFNRRSTWSWIWWLEAKPGFKATGFGRTLNRRASSAPDGGTSVGYGPGYGVGPGIITLIGAGGGIGGGARGGIGGVGGGVGKGISGWGGGIGGGGGFGLGGIGGGFGGGGGIGGGA
ncbi:glycine-rich cell wall structural protein-like [Lycium barbarum]|uniref:glycine-rich cell wall structural protein-like n=1 Tax=Lycium barbarum TaxID=112863 RepID=UPI00293E08EB|nr:glycine-rich cell wall structural protein-like [Lycium barbarum]